jgi:hypothetical protein
MAGAACATGGRRSYCSRRFRFFIRPRPDFPMRIPLDPDGRVVEERYAVVYAPRRARDRFPDSCVTLADSADAARAAADPAQSRFPAVVLGPSRSSEGLMLYYLVQWLDDPAS